MSQKFHEEVTGLSRADHGDTVVQDSHFAEVWFWPGPPIFFEESDGSNL